MDVLIEARCSDIPCAWQGYTDTYLKVVFASHKNLANKIIRLRLSKLKNGKILGILP